MQLRYRFRIYPAAGQRNALARAFGCAMVVFNDALRAREDARAAGVAYVGAAELSAALTAAKRAPTGRGLHDRDVNAARNILDEGRRITAG